MIDKSKPEAKEPRNFFWEVKYTVDGEPRFNRTFTTTKEAGLFVAMIFETYGDQVTELTISR